MNALIKKEIRLLLPAWIVAMLLAILPACTRADDEIPVFLLGFGLTMMALTTIGRESSLNTFSTMLAQPAERLRFWKTKLSVLSAAFLTVFLLWLVAFVFSWWTRGGSDLVPEHILIAACLIATATFTGGLWATLLLRQIAGAFWLTLVVPAVLSGLTAAFLEVFDSELYVIAALCVITGIYSVGGFLFARWLFFRAQDVGWTGGNIVLPEWKLFSARSATGEEVRIRRPVFALLKKEIQLHQISLLGAAGLLVAHIGVLVLRANHKFAHDSAGEVLTAIFWMFWLMLPVMIGAMAVAEERRLGVMEGQLCLPASRRVQFIIKGFLALFLGVLLGGVMPALLEAIGAGSGMWKTNGPTAAGFFAALIGLSLWLSLVSFFASSLAKNFLQAVGFALATFVGFTLIFAALMDGRMFFFDAIPGHSVLPFIFAVPILIFALILMTYLNFKNFRDGWFLWRRNLLGVAGTIVFIVIGSSAIYNRAWEIFLPAEPAHGAAKLSLANPPRLQIEGHRDNLLVRLPDGRVWFDWLHDPFAEPENGWWATARRVLFPPLPKSGGPGRFLSGSNWVCASAQRIDEWSEIGSGDAKERIHIFGFAESFGIQLNGTLWASEKSDQNKWTADRLTQFGSETNWQQAARYFGMGALLLKKDGTLWQWRNGTNRMDWKQWPQNWPGLRAFQPQQIGTDSDWKTFFDANRSLVKKIDGTVWHVASDRMMRATNYDAIPPHDHSETGQYGAFVRDDGTLWLYGDLHCQNRDAFEMLQSGHDTNWISVAATWNNLVALKADGTLWNWDRHNQIFAKSFVESPARLGIHHDWVAVAGVEIGVISLAADGSLWFWPSPDAYQYAQPMMKLPKQPQLLGNVFGPAE